ncbi:MAG: FkbM family methyltransferase [Cyanobacteria bacterium]|nr:FkbM family methyltransferase [Cyanobacteriota bacterium]
MNVRDRVRSLAPALLINAAEVVDAFESGHAAPPLRFRNGLTLWHAKDDPVPWVFFEIFCRHDYTCEFYEPKAGDVVIDGGANIGMFALYLCGLEPSIRVCCFEPCAATFARLATNIERNGLGDRVSLYPYALYSTDAVKSLKPTVSSGDRSLFQRSKVVDGPEELVQCVSLAKAFELCEASTIDLLKLDIEGAELEVLEGASGFDWTRVRRVSVEVHQQFRPHCVEIVEAALRRYGFDRLDSDIGGAFGRIKAARNGSTEAVTRR